MRSDLLSDIVAYLLAAGFGLTAEAGRLSAISLGVFCEFGVDIVITKLLECFFGLEKNIIESSRHLFKVRRCAVQ